ncbi:MAG: segregation/condensation protein A [Acidimicrobiia bacterium]|nr:segregation/condensation protein A [Acidimicrobiia bacterium]
MAYEVKTEVFEGPLDLLLQLITSHQVEITDLSLGDLVSEYLGYLDAIREMDMEMASEFILIAATLIQLKARHLLPDDVEIDLDEELALAGERDRLLSRLLACLTFKDVAAVLAHRMEANERFVSRLVGLSAEDIEIPPPKLMLSMSVDELARVAARAVYRPREVDLDHLDLDLPSVDLAIADLRRRVEESVETDFERLTAHLHRPIEVVAYFLALLELARWGIVGVSQDDRESPISVEHRPDTADIMTTSEWSSNGDQGIT